MFKVLLKHSKWHKKKHKRVCSNREEQDKDVCLWSFNQSDKHNWFNMFKFWLNIVVGKCLDFFVVGYRSPMFSVVGLNMWQIKSAKLA